jgi:hypothetical protein
MGREYLLGALREQDGTGSGPGDVAMTESFSTLGGKVRTFRTLADCLFSACSQAVTFRRFHR